jgi:putative transposase
MFRKGVREIIKAVTVRLFPTGQQVQLLWKHVNVSRFTWNYGLQVQRERHESGQKHLSGYELRKVFTELKKKQEYEWLKEISSHTISNVCLDLDSAYKRFFKKISGKPKFKKKNKCKNAFPVRQENFYLINSCANIEKVGKIKYQTNYELPQGIKVCKYSNPRVKFENDKWILTFGIERENQALKLTDKSMGIDLGVKGLAVVAFGNENLYFKNINKAKRIVKLKSKLKHLERKASRKYYTNNKNKVFEKKWHKSNGILKTEKQIRKIHNKLSDIRKNYLHQTTHSLVSMLPKKVTMEDLNISGMMKNKHLSKAIQEQCLHEFIRQMKYKCEWNGIEFIQVSMFYPSSKTCSACGRIKFDLKLKDRIYKCEHCGTEIDRDLNAAINLMNYSNV